MTPQINFKDPRWIAHFLDTALKKEQEKYKKCPVMRDVVPDHEAAEVWGYVVTAYFLAEESLKALLFLRNKPVPRKHSLSILFNLLENDDRATMRMFYSDYLATNDGYDKFPFQTLIEFLENLDGDPNQRDTDYVGSFDWRYFLIENRQSCNMPLVSIELMHEIVYGCNGIVRNVRNSGFNPFRRTHSWRLREKRREKYDDWLLVQQNSCQAEKLAGKLVILWGPDYCGRYDMFLVNANGAKDYFAEKPTDSSIPIVDKRIELEDFDADAGFRTIGISVGRPSYD